MSEQGNYNVLVEVKKTTIWLRKKDAEKPIDGRIKNQGVIMIENKIILIEDDKEIRGMINDYLSGEFEVTAFNDGMSAIQKITSYDEYALALIDLMLPDIAPHILPGNARSVPIPVARRRSDVINAIITP